MPRTIAPARIRTALLTRYHNRRFGYPIVLAHDEPVGDALRAELAEIAEIGSMRATTLRFVKLEPELPPWVDESSVPEQVLGFPVSPSPISPSPHLPISPSLHRIPYGRCSASRWRTAI